MSLNVAVPWNTPMLAAVSVRVTVIPVSSESDANVTSTVSADPASLFRSASVTVIVAVSSSAYVSAFNATDPLRWITALPVRVAVPPPDTSSSYVAARTSPGPINRMSRRSLDAVSLKVIPPVKKPVSLPVSVSVRVIPVPSEVDVTATVTLWADAGSVFSSMSSTVIVAVSSSAYRAASNETVAVSDSIVEVAVRSAGGPSNVEASA